ncbi:MAG: hypothetical protein OXC10_13745 [Rhodospirillaceae bacterium]|nr:hypothetical protein [Rhodospirillaceae bacterium]
MRLLSLAAVAALALTAGACAAPSGGKSSSEGVAGATAKAVPGSRSGASGNETEGKKQSWWRRHVGPPVRPRQPGDVPPGPGLFSGKDGEIVLFRRGEAGRSSGLDKPTKVKR